MRTLKHLVILSLVVLVAVFIAAPSAMAKKALSEDELDLITAAGQPKIIQTGTGTITFTDSPVNTLSLGTDSQTSLTALTVNNVAGEVQLANAINIATISFGAGPTQANTITQSWGATKDWSSASVAGVTASAVVSITQSITVTNTCTKCGIQRIGTVGGNTATPVVTATAASGIVKILTKYADDIVETVSGDITVDQNGLQTLNLDPTSQRNLSALVVNNIVGLTQVANGINVLAASVGMNPSIPSLAFSQAGVLTAPLSQANTINQFRGTPFSRPASP